MDALEAERATVDSLFQKNMPPPGLEEAVREALAIRTVLTSIRYRCLNPREEGLLHQIIEAWYVQLHVPNGCLDNYPDSLERRNPYAAFKRENRIFADWYARLDFLLQEIRVAVPLGFPLPLTEDEVQLVLSGLQPGGTLASLITKSPYLTHAENVAIAVLDARLWLRSSPLPVVLGSHVSYADVRENVPLPKRPSDALPSTFHILIREATVGVYLSMDLHPDLQLRHLTPSDFPDGEQDCFWGQLARVRYPHHLKKGGQVNDLVARLASCGKLEDSVLHNLEDWKQNETGETYTLLTKFIHDKTPAMHEELKQRLQWEEEEEDLEDLGLRSFL